MTTLRESLQAEIETVKAKAQADVTALETRLADLEASATTLLETDAAVVKAWFVSLRSHLGL